MDRKKNPVEIVPSQMYIIYQRIEQMTIMIPCIFGYYTICKKIGCFYLRLRLLINHMEVEFLYVIM